jgi:hypothetical protein
VSAPKEKFYIALDEEGRAMWAENRKTFAESRGVLYKSRHATLFVSRSRAETAIRRTHRYSTDHGFQWPTHRYTVTLAEVSGSSTPQGAK